MTWQPHFYHFAINTIGCFFSAHLKTPNQFDSDWLQTVDDVFWLVKMCLLVRSAIGGSGSRIAVNIYVLVCICCNYEHDSILLFSPRKHVVPGLYRERRLFQVADSSNSWLPTWLDSVNVFVSRCNKVSYWDQCITLKRYTLGTKPLHLPGEGWGEEVGESRRFGWGEIFFDMLRVIFIEVDKLQMFAHVKNIVIHLVFIQRTIDVFG